MSESNFPTTPDPKDELDGIVPSSVGRRGVLTGLLGAGAVTGGAALTTFGGAAPAAADSERDNRPFVAKAVLPVNVRDYGAAGDGQADDTAAIQTAIEATDPMRPVYFPAGEYVLSAPLQVSAPTSFMGDGMWASIIRRTTGDVLAAFDGAVGRFEMTDLACDGAGQVANLFEVAGDVVQSLQVRACRFTNLRQADDKNDFDFACFRVPGVAHAAFSDCLWHNPAEHAGWGMALLVKRGESAGRIEFTGTNRFLWLSNAIRVQVRRALPGSVDLVRIAGAYFDGFSYHLPAGWAGQGGSVEYSSDGLTLTDTGADFSNVPSGSHPRYLYVRAMPVRHAGELTAATAQSVVQDGADMRGAGIVRGDIVRSDGVFAIVEGADEGVDGSVIVEGWLDNDTLRPAPPPSPGTAFTVYGLVMASIEATTSTSLTLSARNGGGWFDMHGNSPVPEAGTRYEILQTRPGQHAVLADQVRHAHVSDSVFRRAQYDALTGTSLSLTATNNIFDSNAELHLSRGGLGKAIVTGNDFRHSGGNALHLAGIGCVVTGNRSHGVGYNRRRIDSRTHYTCLGRNNYWGSNIAIADPNGNDDVMDQSGLKLQRIKYPGEPAITTEDNIIEGNVFVGMKQSDVLAFINPLGVNDIRGTARVAYRPDTPAQRITASAAGSPEGVVRAVPGSTYVRTDGEPGATFYVKESGDGVDGWTALGSGG